MIQLIGLRPYTDKSGVVKLSDTFHEKNWRVESIYELFKNAEAYVKMVPEDQRWNLFYTVANCTEEKRQFLKQDVLPIDIDGIVRGTEAQVVSLTCQELGIPEDKVGVIYSGNGVHILIGLKNPIMEAGYIRMNKPYYRAMCGRINAALFEAGVAGKADPVVFSEARLLRMPFTENRKEGKTTVPCTLINREIVPLDVDLFTLADLPSISEGEHIHPRALARLPKPDSAAVQSKCSFLQHCKDTTEPISEPEWYAMLSIIGRLEDGETLIHTDYGPKGNKHPNYNSGVFSDKLQHALEASGPRTCSNIALMHDGCKACPYNGKITSPIQLVGENTIRTLETGFYNIVFKDGVAKTGKPNYDDLVKYYAQKHEYVTIDENESVLVWNGTHWHEIERAWVHNFAECNFNPSPTTTMCAEFESKLKRTNLRGIAFTQVDRKLNFKNGVLDLETGTIEPHSSKFGFTYTIPYDYAPTGKCDTFKKFISEVTCGDEELGKLIMEYMGYCLSGADPADVQKCAVLHGDGANGKSVLLQLMREMVGQANCTSISVNSLQKENYRYQMMHKMFNVSDEAPSDSFINSSIFKAIVSGDPIEVRKLYKEPMMWKCTTKLMFACNDLPFSSDFSHGMFRRLIIIPFKATFSDAKGNRDPYILSKLLPEKSDIFKLCLEYFVKVRANGCHFTVPESSVEELDDYIITSDLVDRFVNSMCDMTSKEAVLDIETVYNLFATWCMDNHQKPMNYSSFTRRFGKKIKSKHPSIERTRPRTDGGSRTVAYKHLLIKAVNPALLQSNF